MRRYIRATHVDVRANSKVQKDLHAWIAALPIKKSRKRAMSFRTMRITLRRVMLLIGRLGP